MGGGKADGVSARSESVSFLRSLLKLAALTIVLSFFFARPIAARLQIYSLDICVETSADLDEWVRFVDFPLETAELLLAEGFCRIKGHTAKRVNALLELNRDQPKFGLEARLRTELGACPIDNEEKRYLLLLSLVMYLGQVEFLAQLCSLVEQSESEGIKIHLAWAIRRTWRVELWVTQSLIAENDLEAMLRGLFKRSEFSSSGHCWRDRANW